MPLFQNRKPKQPPTSAENSNSNPYGYQPHQPTVQTSNNNDSNMYAPNNQQQHQLSARDQEIARLQAHVQSLSNQLESAKQQQAADRAKNAKREIKMSPHAHHIHQVDSQSKRGGKIIRTGKERMGRKASISTQRVMAALPSTDNEHAAQPEAMRVLEMFKEPSAHVDYLNSENFAKDM